MKSIAVALVAFSLSIVGCASKGTSEPLICYSGASMSGSVEELAAVYERRSGVKVTVEAGDPKVLMDKIVSTQHGDLFVHHDPYLEMLAKRGMGITGAWTAASMRTVIAVAKGNPKKITRLEDLGRPGVRLAMADAEGTSLGMVSTYMLRKAGISKEADANTVIRTGPGRDWATAITSGSADAGIVWDAGAFAKRDQVDEVKIDPKWHPTRGSIAESPTRGRLELDYVRVTVGTLKSSSSRSHAKAFAKLLASPEGEAAFLRKGFSPKEPGRATLISEK